MKKLLSLLIVLFVSLSSVFGQSNRSTIRFRLSNGDLIRVALNGRYYNKTAKSLTIGDIPGKKIRLKVYKFRPYAHRKGGKATLIYNGKIKIDKGSTYEALIKTKSHKLYLTKVSRLPKHPGNLPPPEDNIPLKNKVTPTSPEINALDTHKSHPSKTLSAAMQHLKSQMDKEVSDTKKLEKAKDYLISIPEISAENVYDICTWLLFDNNRMEFVKTAYNKVTNPEKLDRIKKTFTEDSSKKEFEAFLKKQ